MNKKTAIFFLSCILSAVAITNSFAQKAGAIEQDNPSPYTELLSDSVRAIILSADSVNWMLIDPWIFEDSVIFSLGEPVGEILSEHTSIDTPSNQRMAELITSPCSFVKDSLAKECTYLPDIAVLFKSNNDSVLVSYSLYCDVCRIQTVDKYIDYDGEIVRDDFLRLFKVQFPKDKFVRNISRNL